jgi:hypothetical protein
MNEAALSELAGWVTKAGLIGRRRGCGELAQQPLFSSAAIGRNGDAALFGRR